MIGSPTRRTLLRLALGVLAAGSTASAQEPGRVYRLGGLHAAPRAAPHMVAFLDELRRLGFIEGQNLIDDPRGYGLSPEQFDKHASELVKAQVDVIIAGGPGVRAAQRATSEIPILAVSDDMVGEGFVRSLGNPGGNITGVTILASELDGKRQEILLEAVPGTHRIAALADSNTSTSSHLQALEAVARAQGVELSVHRVARREDIVPAIDAAKALHATAVNVLASSLLWNNRFIIFERVATLRVPAIYQWPEMAAQGGLIGYGPSIVQLFRDVLSRQLASLLRGAKPAAVPVEQPTKFELFINANAAKALGLNLPPALLARADEVIE